MGRLPAGLVRVKKTVETTVTTTGSPAAGFVTCGIPSTVEEGTRLLLPLGVPVGMSSTEGVEEGSTGRVVGFG